MGRDDPPLRLLRPLLAGLLRADPDRRWGLEKVRAALEDIGGGRESRAGARASGGGAGDRVAGATQDLLVTDGLRYLTRTRTPAAGRLRESGDFGTTTDPCNVQHGAAGVLSVLTQAQWLAPQEGVADLPHDTAQWIGDRVGAVPRLLPGLHFGRSGTAWARYDRVAPGIRTPARHSSSVPERRPPGLPGPAGPC